MKNLILIGFMGAGKTTVGKLLAREKEMLFVDTDERIVSEQGREIPDSRRRAKSISGIWRRIFWSGCLRTPTRR